MLRFLKDIFHDENKARRIYMEVNKATKTIDEAVNEIYEDKINYEVFFRVEAKQFENFLSVACKDEELSEYVESSLLSSKEEFEAYLRNILSWMQTWKKLREYT